MKYNIDYVSTSKISKFESALEELKTAKNNTDDFNAWIDASDLTFFHKNDKDKSKPLSLDSFFYEVKQITGTRVTPDIAEGLLQYFIDGKQEFKDMKISEKNLKILKGPKYTKEELSYKSEKITLRDELFHVNTFDTNLFQNFKLCGGQLILVEENETELLVEDKQGKISIPNNLFLKGKIGSNVLERFLSKIKTYYNKFQNFLATIDVDKIEIDVENGIIETPIEDFIQTNLPTTFAKFYDVYAVYKTWLDQKGKTQKSLDHFELRRNPKIESFDEILDYVVDNWRKFKRTISGQQKFFAWSNDPKQIAVSHWFPEEVKTCPAPWAEFLKEKMDEHFSLRLIAYLGMCMDAENTSQQYLIISDEGGTGKGVMMRALESVLPKESISSIDGNLLEDGNDFGLAGIKVWNTHISVMEEYNSNSLQSNKAKKMIANNPMDLNVKNKSFIHWEPINHKLIVFSNNGAVIKDFANRRRAIPLTFKGKYVYTEEKSNKLKETAKDFLNYCYTVYKDFPLYKDSRYLVLSKEDEEAFFKGTLTEQDDDKLSKRAFNEELLKDFFTTDEYSDTEEYCDYENTYNDLFEESEDDFVSVNDMRKAILEYCAENTDYMDSFGVKKQGNEYFIPKTNNTQYWKWGQFLDGKNKPLSVKKLDGRCIKIRKGIKLKK